MGFFFGFRAWVGLGWVGLVCVALRNEKGGYIDRERQIGGMCVVGRREFGGVRRLLLRGLVDSMMVG